MRERGTVLTAQSGELSVEMQSSADCETCGACAAGAGGARVMHGVIDSHHARPGDVVEIETPVSARRRAQGLVYVVPVLAIAGGYVAGFLLSSWTGFLAPDSVGAVGAVVSGFAALLLLRRRDHSFDAPSARPKVRAIIARGHDVSGTHDDRAE